MLSVLMILLSKCDQASELWQQLELSSEFESDLHDTVDRGRKWLVDFNGGKTQLVLFDQSNSTVAIDGKVGGSVEERSSFKILGLTFSSKLDWSSYIISIASSMNFFILLRLLCIFVNLPYGNVRNTVVMFGLVVLVATWN